MTAVEIRPFRHSLWKSESGEVVRFYNLALTGVHGFYPITKRNFHRRILESEFFQPELFLLAHADNKIVGIAHAAILTEPCYEHGGVVEMIAVHPDYRRQGIGGRLLDAIMVRFATGEVPLIDGGGAFPFSPFYTTLLDGSERSGPEINNFAAIALFESRGFVHSRESIIMVADLKADLPAIEEEKFPEMTMQIIPRKPGATWLDYVFRDWQLNNSVLLEKGESKILSRAIFAFMSGPSLQEKLRLYAVFGVNTPPEYRGQGWATIHMRMLQQYLRTRGADKLELHVYTDNIPAVSLYKKTGFTEINRTTMMRKSGF